MLDPIDFAIIKFADCVSDELLRQIEAEGEVQRYKKGKTIEQHGDPSTHITLIKSGLIRLRLNEADGTRFNLSILGSGSTFGETALFLGLPTQFDAYCETDVELIRFSNVKIDRLMESNSEFFKALNKIANARVNTMLNYIGASIRAPLETRVAKFLTLMCNETDDHETIHCRQADLAHALGISRVSMGKSLKSLENKGLIELGYGKILIPSRAKLESAVTSITSD